MRGRERDGERERERERDRVGEHLASSRRASYGMTAQRRVMFSHGRCAGTRMLCSVTALIGVQGGNVHACALVPLWLLALERVFGGYKTWNVASEPVQELIEPDVQKFESS